MSVSICVFVEGARLPSASAWAAAIREKGFPLALDANVDLRTLSGFLPCEFEGEASGFECFIGAASEYLEAQALDATRIGARDTVVDLVTHSDMRELECSVIAASVLCAMADGVVWEAESGEWIAAADAPAWARDVLSTS